MGQYYKIVNIDKHEYISPSHFGSGLKLMEFAYPGNPSLVLSALAILLADGNNRGSGDLRSDNPIIGSWKYDRVAVVGDYADPVITDENYYFIAENWKNVSKDVLVAMVDDYYFAHEYAELIQTRLKGKNCWLIPRMVVNMAHDYENDTDAQHLFSKLFEDEGEREEIIQTIKEKIEAYAWV